VVVRDRGVIVVGASLSSVTGCVVVVAAWVCTAAATERDRLSRRQGDHARGDAGPQPIPPPEEPVVVWALPRR